MADPKPLTFVCPECGHHAAPAGFAVDADSKQYAALLADLPPPVARAVMSYIALFAPRARKLTAPRARKLLEELAPLIKAERITRRGREWIAPQAAWITAIDDLLARRDKLTLPLTTHGYLLDVLTSTADRIERAAEDQREQQLRQGRRAALDEGAVGGMIRRAVRPVETQAERMERLRREAEEADRRLLR